MLPSKRRNHIMLVNIDAEMSEILSVCSQTGRAESVLTGCYFEVNEG
jgi:hypothetical protein